MTHIQRIKIYYKLYLFVTKKKLWLFGKDLLFASSVRSLFRYSVVSMVTVSIPEKPDASIFGVRDRDGMFFRKFGKHLSLSIFKKMEGMYRQNVKNHLRSRCLHLQT